MSKAQRPWMKWYPADWRSDPGLRMCGFAARGLWADMLALMHEAEPYGHLLVNGKRPTPQQLAALLGGTAREIERLLHELSEAGVFSETTGGVLYSRRMVRDREKDNRDRDNGGKGGNPKLTDPDNGGVNPQDNGDVKAQKPEARSQKPDSSSGEELPPKPPKARSRRKAGDPLPSGWVPRRVDWESAGLDDVGGAYCAAKMRNWAEGSDARKVSWDATYRNFCLDEAKSGRVPRKVQTEPSVDRLMEGLS